MNILYIISSLRHGGAERQTVEDANYFSEKNNVILVTFAGGELESLLDKKVRHIVLEKNGYLSTSKKLREILTREKIDLINASLFAAMIIAVRASGKINIPVFWYFHSHEYDIALKSRLAFKYYSKKSCLKKIFFVSSELKSNFYDRGFGFPEEKTKVLYNNYSVKNVNHEKCKGSNIIIGSIGRLVELKRIEYLLELAEFLKSERIEDFRIVIAGDGPEREKLERLSEEKNVKDYIDFEGFQEDVEKYYERFDIFALPSREECLSISLIDAGVKRLPAVAFDTGGNMEIILNGETGYIVKSKTEFYERIKELVNDSGLRDDFGNAAGLYCEKKFNKESRMSKLENIFENKNGGCEKFG